MSILFFYNHTAIADEVLCRAPISLTIPPLSKDEISKQLGWIESENRCGGYYYEEPFLPSDNSLNNEFIQITSNEGLFSLHGTSISQGKVTITYQGQQIIANKMYLYRDPNTGKLSAIDLINHVILREPNDLVIASCGHFDLKTKAKSLKDVLYRTTIYSDLSRKKITRDTQEIRIEHEVTQLSAWGKAENFVQNKPNVYEFDNATYSTCPPKTCTWKVKASRVTLDKNTGRGVARNARILVRGIPIFYSPYLNFPIDSRRETGFLFPTFGTSSRKGPYFSAPFYWNLAPNYDTTITPSYLSKRGLQITDLYRYITEKSSGNLRVSVLPGDKLFKDFKTIQETTFANSTNSQTLANLQRLKNASTTRKALSWQHDVRFNEHWSSNINYNYVGDDYYVRDFGNNFNEITQNQLLQQADVNYKGQYWHFLGRIQQYQTLHPVDENVTYQNQYSRFPELSLEGNYPDQRTGLNYFISNELTHFDIRDTPGTNTKMPMGNRTNIQPGISYPFYRPAFYINPRLQFAATQYEIGHVNNGYQKAPSRSLPIFDVSTGLNFDRDINLFNRPLRQTLEPLIYYTYIPYRNQNQLPIFDTTLNTLTYDQLFVYNRFSGLDRIGDANQVGVGVTTRFIDQQTGLERIRASIGQIIYFQNRRVVLPNDSINNEGNRTKRSPISGLIKYYLNPNWSLTDDTIWSSHYNHLMNQTLTLQYKPNDKHIINLGYSFVRNGDRLPTDPVNSASTNLSQTDLSVAWPVSRDWSAVGRWTQNWNHHRFQNLLYGLQYDSCCWAIRVVSGRAFTGLNSSNTYQYDTQFYIQVALKGLGNAGSGDPASFLSTNISGYQSNFGQDF